MANLTLQEIVTRGRHLFASAPSRFAVFKQVNGNKTAKNIADKLDRNVTGIHRDLRYLKDAGLIAEVLTADGNPKKKDGQSLYDKIGPAKILRDSHFRSTGRRPEDPIDAASRPSRPSSRSRSIPERLETPDEPEILRICDDGESQIHEFKAAGTDVAKLAKEVTAMANTRRGGLVLYGISDDGTVQGSDVTNSVLDQRLQNCLRNRVSPTVAIDIATKTVLGNDVLVITVPPWNPKSGDVYHFDARVYIRRGTNADPATQTDSRKLHDGHYVI